MIMANDYDYDYHPDHMIMIMISIIRVWLRLQSWLYVCKYNEYIIQMIPENCSTLKFTWFVRFELKL